MIYRHYKGGLYRVLFEDALESTNRREREKLVVYVSLSEKGSINVRRWAEFHETVEYEGERVARFSAMEIRIGHRSGT